jgi:Flp pilus assembly pilin Flp
MRTRLFSVRKALKAHAHARAFLKDCRGQGIVEYVLILALVATAAVAGEQGLACRLSCAFENLGHEFERIIMDFEGKKIPPGQLKKCTKTCS